MKLSEWEKVKGAIVIGYDPDKELSEEEFDSIPMSEKVGVDFESRTEFLTSNDYELTRENMIDSTLPSRKQI